MVDREQLVELGVMAAASVCLVAASYGLRALEPATSVQRASQVVETEVVTEVALSETETLTASLPTPGFSAEVLEDAQENIPDRPVEEDFT